MSNLFKTIVNTKLYVIMSSLVCLTLMSSASNAAVTNGDFETGDFTGWSVISPADSSVVTSFGTSVGTVFPVTGSYFASLSTPGGAGSIASISQVVSMSAGETLQGYASWANERAFAGEPSNDTAQVVVSQTGGGPSTTVWSVSGTDAPFFPPWTFWSFVAPVDGNYNLQMSITDLTSPTPINQNTAFFDAVSLVPVPEPGTYVILVGGLLVTYFLCERKSRKTQKPSV